jgi:ribonuclease Z
MIKVQFLGTSGSVPTEKRGMPAVYLEFRGNRMLFDCGEGTQRQMRIAGLPFMKLGRIFISHFHADHCLGLGGLIQTMDLFKRTEKLEVYGPKGVQEVVEKIITTGNFILDGFDLEINEVRPKGVKQIYADRDGIVKCALMDHTVPCLGFSFEEPARRKFLKAKALGLGVPEGPLFHRLQLGESVKVGKKVIRPEQVLEKAVPGRKVTYIPDTRPCAAAIELAKNSSIIIHDSTFAHDLQASALEGKHSTSKEAAEVAKRAKAKQLYLTHFSQRYASKADMEKMGKDALAVFQNTKLASDFDIATL